MKKGLDEFKEALIEGETFSGEVNKIKSIEDAFDIAQRNGFDFTLEELENSEISDDILDCVAGGKGTTNVESYKYITPSTTHNTNVTFVEDD